MRVRGPTALVLALAAIVLIFIVSSGAQGAGSIPLRAASEHAFTTQSMLAQPVRDYAVESGSNLSFNNTLNGTANFLAWIFNAVYYAMIITVVALLAGLILGRVLHKDNKIRTTDQSKAPDVGASGSQTPPEVLPTPPEASTPSPPPPPPPPPGGA